jgi:hypothetical protein
MVHDGPGWTPESIIVRNRLGRVIVLLDNDGLHGDHEASGVVALAPGRHPVTVTFFQKTGDLRLEVGLRGPGLEKQRVAPATLCHGE